MDQENAAPEPNGETSFANLVEALLPTAPPVDPGAELPATDSALPGEIAADPTLVGGVAFAAVPPFGANIPAASRLNGSASSPGLAMLRTSTPKTAASGAAALAVDPQHAGEYDPTASIGSDFGDAWRDFAKFAAELLEKIKKDNEEQQAPTKERQ
jgi:hypothetical protein